MTDGDNQSEERGSNAGKSPKRTRRAGRSIFTVAVVGYGAMVIMLVSMETRLVFPGAYLENQKYTYEDPGDAGDEIVDVQYQSRDGVMLTGRLLHRPDSPNHLIFYHGNAAKARWLDGWTRRLADHFDATVMVAEYRGFEGGPKPDEEGVIEDSLAARDYLCDKMDLQPTDLTIIGNSLGGACAVAVAADGGAKALVLIRTFERVTEVAAGKFPFAPVRTLMRNRFDSAGRIKDFHGPVIQLHGTTDRIVPIEHGRALFESANEPKHWIEVPNLGHNDLLSEESMGQIVSLFKDAVSPSSND